MNLGNISITSLTTILIKNNFVSPKASRDTKRNHQYKTGKYETFNDDEIIDSVLYDLSRPKDKKDMNQTRIKRENFGEEVQMDASEHIWFGKTKIPLTCIIDHSTGTVLGIQFEEQEILVSYYNLFEQILSEYGAPYEITTDNRTALLTKQKGANS
ncbi:MAG: hypothetical protein ACRC5R_02655 [Mycoplasmatales bacterium]